jgi:hypothetical protein
MNPTARRLVPLTLGVLAAHGALLHMRSETLAVRGAPQAATFVTRKVDPSTDTAAAPAPQPSAEASVPAAAGAAAPPAVGSIAPPTPSPPRLPAPPAATAPVAEPTAPAPAPAPPPAATLVDPNAPSSQAASRGDTWRASSLPEPARMSYEVVIEARGVRVRGDALLVWRHDGRDYDARLEVSAPFLPSRVQQSTGRITADGLEPRRFSDEGRRGQEATHFVPEQGKIVFSNNRPEAALAAGTQDRLSVVIQLSVIIAGEPNRYPPGSSIAIPTAGIRDAETWVFTVEGEESLALPGGTLRALKLQRLPRKEFDQKVELWLAPAKDYAPVRLRLTNPNGDSVDQRWASTDKG